MCNNIQPSSYKYDSNETHYEQSHEFTKKKKKQ